MEKVVTHAVMVNYLFKLIFRDFTKVVVRSKTFELGHVK